MQRTKLKSIPWQLLWTKQVTYKLMYSSVLSYRTPVYSQTPDNDRELTSLTQLDSEHS